MRLAVIIAAALAWPSADDPLPPPVPRVQWHVYTATWCPPCKAAQADFRPFFERLKPRRLMVSVVEHADIRLIDVDVEKEEMSEWCKEWGPIPTVPHFVLLVDGEPIERHYRYPGKLRMQDAYTAAVASLKVRK